MKIIDHRLSFGSRSTYFESLRTPGGDLMDQCSKRHDIPSALQATHQPAGARSTVRNRPSLQVLKVLTGRRLGDQPLANRDSNPSSTRRSIPIRFSALMTSGTRRHLPICHVVSPRSRRGCLTNRFNSYTEVLAACLPADKGRRVSERLEAASPQRAVPSERHARATLGRRRSDLSAELRGSGGIAPQRRRRPRPPRVW
jgi:hypothetical protein